MTKETEGSREWKHEKGEPKTDDAEEGEHGPESKSKKTLEHEKERLETN